MQLVEKHHKCYKHLRTQTIYSDESMHIKNKWLADLDHETFVLKLVKIGMSVAGEPDKLH